MPPARLNQTLLDTLTADVARPAYDRDKVRPGIVHLGIGAFHRGHMAVYVDALLADTPGWGIVGVSLRRPDTKAALAPQDGLYTVALRDASGTQARVIGSILSVMDANEQSEALLALMADPTIRIVSLTVTEKGYCHDPATGALDENHPDIVHDLAHPHAPKSAPGLLVEALARRRAAGVAPFTVMSCDNLPANGRTAKHIVASLAARRDPALGQWVETLAFPSSMVDRIVPATAEADRLGVAELLGAEDAWPVVTEPFSQWVIEDDFPAGRPAFERAGAQMVADVAPFEHMKLRMLNGAHSCMAYLGYLGGYDFIAEVMRDPAYAGFIRALMSEEIMPTLDLPIFASHGLDLATYRDQLLARFTNPALKHRTWQIAMDGSQKLPQRLLATIRDRRAAGQGIARLSLGVAGWMRYVTGSDEKGQPIDVRDPLGARLKEIATGAGADPAVLFTGLVGLNEVFGADLARDSLFAEAVIGHLNSLFALGARETVARAAAAT